MPGWRFTGVEPSDAMLAVARRRLEAEGAPLVLGCRVGKDPELTNVELRRWRAYGVPPDELERRRQLFAAMRPIESDAALFAMFTRTGLVAPRPIFVSLQYKVFLARFEPGAAG